jgi:hypothetical protein
MSCSERVLRSLFFDLAQSQQKLPVQRSLAENLQIVARLALILERTKPSLTKFHHQLDETKLARLWSDRPSLRDHMVTKLAPYVCKNRIYDPILMLDVMDHGNRQLVLSACGVLDEYDWSFAIDFYSSFVKGEGPIYAIAEAIPYIQLDIIAEWYMKDKAPNSRNEKEETTNQNDTNRSETATGTTATATGTTDTTATATSATAIENPTSATENPASATETTPVPTDQKSPIPTAATPAGTTDQKSPLPTATPAGATDQKASISANGIVSSDASTTPPFSFPPIFFSFFHRLSPVYQTSLILFYVCRAESLGYSVPTIATH